MHINDEWVIDVQDLVKKFGEKVAVDQVSLQIKKGEVFGFLGPNGSGKTTTMRMICGLLTPDGGQGRCLGKDIVKEAKAIHKQIGYMTQKFSYYEDLTVRENIDFVARLYQVENRKKIVNDVIEELEFSWRDKQLAGSLSGGWKQRLALGAALVHSPKLLLLDEPTAGVDPSARRDFWDQIHQLAARGITTLVSTHYMDEADRCHRLAYVAYGHLITYGTADSIIEESGLCTYQAKGGDLFALDKKLQQDPAVEQVSAFGTSLHLCALDEAALDKAVSQYSDGPYQFEKIATTLEDVFIYLMSKNKEQKTW